MIGIVDAYGYRWHTEAPWSPASSSTRPLLVPQAEEAGPITVGSCDRVGHVGQAGIDRAIPHKAIFDDLHVMALASVLAH